MIIDLQITKLEISRKIVNKLFSYTQTEGKNEMGGIILGMFNEKDNIYVIDDVTKPNKEDISEPFCFIRKKNPAQAIINRKWKKSNGIINYMGEWHTHPCANPKPSSVDKELISVIISNRSCKYKIVFMIIVGTNRTLYIEASLNRKINKAIVSNGYNYYEKGETKCIHIQ